METWDDGMGTEGLEQVMRAFMLVTGSLNREEGQVRPPSELYFFVQERCDLFAEAARVARNRQDRDQCRSIASWCHALWCFGKC